MCVCCFKSVCCLKRKRKPEIIFSKLCLASCASLRTWLLLGGERARVSVLVLACVLVSVCVCVCVCVLACVSRASRVQVCALCGHKPGDGDLAVNCSETYVKLLLVASVCAILL